MDAKELAAMLTGCEYQVEIDYDTAAAARESGLVVVFGASDNLMEFQGAINDEIGGGEGYMVTVDSEGIQSVFDELLDEKAEEEVFEDYFRRKGRGKTIEALWDQGDGYYWTFKTEIPHETFEVMNDGEPYCRGIVFAIADIA